MIARVAVALAASLALHGCASRVAPAPPPASPPEAPLPTLPVAPSASSSLPLAPEPDAEPVALPIRAARHRGPAGLSAVAVARAGDVTEARVVVRGAGLAADPSLARAAAEALSARLAARPPPRAARVRVSAALDALVVSISTTDPVISLRALGDELRRAGGDGLPDDAGAPLGEIALFRALYALPASVHPYAELAPTASPRQRDVARFVAERVTAEAITIVTVGALDAAAAHDALAATLGPTPAALAVPRPTPPVSPDAPRLFVIDARRDHAEVTVGLLTLERGDDAWPELLVAARARRVALARLASLEVRVAPLRDGPCPLVARWRTSPGALVGEVRDALAALSLGAPSPPEIELLALRSLTRDHARVAGQPRLLADRLAELAALGRDELPAPPPTPSSARLARSLAEQPASSPVVVVEGPASALAPSLAALGDVTVLDPSRGLAPSRVVKASR
ncbi:MAG: hypothetical protein IT374_09360 [Polyangiaceae bacterium]|nr:hypothetical protein [Polyangiaceae bacterium]